jgi:hypothetical protein
VLVVLYFLCSSWLHVWEHSHFHGAAVAGGVLDGGVVVEPGGDLIGKSMTNMISE